MDTKVKDIIENVKTMVDKGILVPDYEVKIESYVCFIVTTEKGGALYYAGKMHVFPDEVQDSLYGMFLNETTDDYKVVGIYKVVENW